MQSSRISTRVRQIRQGRSVDVQGDLPAVLTVNGEGLLTTTIFVKYHYDPELARILQGITIAAIPNGMLQSRYNPSAEDTIWTAGPKAPTLGEAFRTRLSFNRLAEKADGAFSTCRSNRRARPGQSERKRPEDCPDTVRVAIGAVAPWAGSQTISLAGFDGQWHSGRAGRGYFAHRQNSRGTVCSAKELERTCVWCRGKRGPGVQCANIFAESIQDFQITAMRGFDKFGSSSDSMTGGETTIHGEKNIYSTGTRPALVQGGCHLRSPCPGFF
ncbi:MAG: SfiI family type II restriction endonuclease [Limisphaerales bacterium]